MDASANITILDTHVWLWLMEGDPRLDARRVEELERAASAGSLYVSTLSLWEVAVLEALGRVRFTVPIDTWLEEAIDTPGLNLLEVDSRTAAESARLPGAFSGDPVDCLLVAAARTHGGRLYTADPRIVAYAGSGFVDVVAI